MDKPLIRQAMFREDGTTTDCPTELDENMHLEKQGNLLLWAQEQEKLQEVKP